MFSVNITIFIVNFFVDTLTYSPHIKKWGVLYATHRIIPHVLA